MKIPHSNPHSENLGNANQSQNNQADDLAVAMWLVSFPLWATVHRSWLSASTISFVQKRVIHLHGSSVGLNYLAKTSFSLYIWPILQQLVATFIHLSWLHSLIHPPTPTNFSLFQLFLSFLATVSPPLTLCTNNSPFSYIYALLASVLFSIGDHTQGRVQRRNVTLLPSGGSSILEHLRVVLSAQKLPKVDVPFIACLPPPSPVFASVNARKVSHCSVPAWVQPTSGWRSGKLRIIKYTQCGRNKQSKKKKRNANCSSDLSQTLISMIKSILAIVDLSSPCNLHD